MHKSGFISRKAWKWGLPHFDKHKRKKPFDVIFYLYKMKQSHWLLCICRELWLAQAHHATVKLDSSVASRGMKTFSKSRIELQNLQILKKMLDKSSQFLSSEQLSEPKNLDVALNIAGVEIICSENLRLRSTWRPSELSFKRIGVLETVEICILCGLWFSNQFEIVSETPFSCDTVARELYMYFACCCALKRTGKLASETCKVNVFIYLF